MITINNCGYESRHMTTFEMKRPGGTPDYTLLLIKTAAFFEYNQTLQDTPANTVILYDKSDYVHYGCQTPDYNDDWIHFELEERDFAFFKSLNLPFHTPVCMSQIGMLSEYARLIVMEKHSGHLHREQILDSLMRSLLYTLSSQLQTAPDPATDHKFYSVLNSLRMDILNAPHNRWLVEEMAGKVHMSPSYFQHLYKKLFGISCIREVINARLKNACFYLTTTDMSIHSLASFCGYDNELHFMRQFKKYTSMTPSQYRSCHRA